MKPGMEKVKRKVSSILKSKLKINNVEIKQAHRLTRKKKPQQRQTSCHSFQTPFVRE